MKMRQEHWESWRLLRKTVQFCGHCIGWCIWDGGAGGRSHFSGALLVSSGESFTCIGMSIRETYECYILIFWWWKDHFHSRRGSNSLGWDGCRFQVLGLVDGWGRCFGIFLASGASLVRMVAVDRVVGARTGNCRVVWWECHSFEWGLCGVSLFFWG